MWFFIALIIFGGLIVTKGRIRFTKNITLVGKPVTTIGLLTSGIGLSSFIYPPAMFILLGTLIIVAFVGVKTSSEVKKDKMTKSEMINWGVLVVAVIVIIYFIRTFGT